MWDLYFLFSISVICVFCFLSHLILSSPLLSINFLGIYQFYKVFQISFWCCWSFFYICLCLLCFFFLYFFLSFGFLILVCSSFPNFLEEVFRSFVRTLLIVYLFIYLFRIINHHLLVHPTVWYILFSLSLNSKCVLLQCDYSLNFC